MKYYNLPPACWMMFSETGSDSGFSTANPKAYYLISSLLSISVNIAKYIVFTQLSAFIYS